MYKLLKIKAIIVNKCCTS